MCSGGRALDHEGHRAVVHELHLHVGTKDPARHRHALRSQCCAEALEQGLSVLGTGRTHEVWTGIAVVRDAERRTAAECTRVQLVRLGEPELEAYVKSGEPLDKAGAYGIQGIAAQFVRRIDGEYANVVGLPLARLRQVLAEFV